MYFVPLDLKSLKTESAELGESLHSLSLEVSVYFVTLDLKSSESGSAESKVSPLLSSEVRPGFWRVGEKTKCAAAIANNCSRNNSDSSDGGVG